LGATDSRHYQSLSEQVYRFLPLQVNASDIARIHGVNERLAVDNYADAIAFYMRLIRNFNEQHSNLQAPLTFTSPHRGEGREISIFGSSNKAHLLTDPRRDAFQGSV
jgi:hypothetical protein